MSAPAALISYYHAPIIATGRGTAAIAALIIVSRRGGERDKLENLVIDASADNFKLHVDNLIPQVTCQHQITIDGKLTEQFDWCKQIPCQPMSTSYSASKKFYIIKSIKLKINASRHRFWRQGFQCRSE